MESKVDHACGLQTTKIKNKISQCTASSEKSEGKIDSQVLPQAAAALSISAFFPEQKKNP